MTGAQIDSDTSLLSPPPPSVAHHQFSPRKRSCNARSEVFYTNKYRKSSLQRIEGENTHEYGRQS
jgi:hypothetical protein